jgi:hypothetical protein
VLSIPFFTDADIIQFMLKAFAIVFALLFVLYAFVIYRKTAELLRSFETPNNAKIRAVSFFQLVLSIIVCLYAIIF